MLDLRGFINDLEKEGEVVHVEEEVAVKYEVSAVLEAFNGEKAVIFEKVAGFPVKIVGGVCGTRSRIYKALKVNQAEFYMRLQHAISHPKTPKIVEDAPVKEVIENPSLRRVPILTHFERDAGPYVTSAVLYARNTEEGIENVSIHRLLVVDDNHFAIRMVPRQLYRICQLSREKGKKAVDVSISVGLHPAVLLAASAPINFGVSEFDVANKLLDGKLPLVKCEHVDAYAPANAELVFEAQISLRQKVTEGPFVDLTSTYDVQRQQPLVEVIGVMRREDYIYQALLPAGSEHRLLMGMPQEVRIMEYVKNVVPSVKGINMTLGGCGWLHCVVSFEKFRDGDGKNVLMSIFSANPSIKHAIVVDADIDPYNMRQVEWAIATRFRGDRDLLIIPNTRVSSLDPTADQKLELGCKVGFDATKPFSKPKESFEIAKNPRSEVVHKILNKYLG
ncbi:MAG: UbiD family decarboxylase [Candidatus Bathyarchaeota archaeon]|nr:MAG: UbiD family decarboxylase [Candidatus Bathyarchaeota archaeon]